MKCDPWSLQQQLGEEWSTHPPAYQDSWFRRDVFTAWDKQSKRMWEVLVKENKPIHFMFGNCICWNLSNLTKIVILQLFSLVSSQMCSLKTTCQNRFKFPYGHCFHICNLYLMETGTQCFKEEDFMSHLFICQMSNGERAVAKCLQKLSWHDGILLVLSSLGVVASWAVLFLPAERWTITWTTAGQQGERGAWGSGRSSSSSSSVHQLHSPQSERLLGDLPQWHAFPGYCPL